MHINHHPPPQIDRAQQGQGGLAAVGAAALGSTVPTETPGKSPVDVITLSDAAKAAIAASNEAHGKSADSPAHVAREQFMATKIASGASGIDVRFGDVVSRIARGISTESLFGAAPDSDGDSDGDGDEDATKIASGDAVTGPAVQTPTPTSQDETIVPTEANTAAGGAIDIAAIAKPIGDIDILDLLSSKEDEVVGLII